MILLQNSLAVVVRDKFPVSEWHLLIIPKRHTADYFDLGSAEVRACQTYSQKPEISSLRRTRPYWVST